jgi:ferredoxin
VSCKACGLCVGASDRRFRSKQEAIAAWNTRPEQASEAEIRNAALEEAAIDTQAQADLIRDGGEDCATAAVRTALLTQVDRIRALSTTPAEPSQPLILRTQNET